MVTLAIRFPAGRFHATPWDRHVNEGVAEWPVSPWRILRALTAALHTRCPELDRKVATATIKKLVTLPSFTLPPAATGHTRHYLSANAVQRTDSNLTFDTFVALDRDATVYVHWPVELETAEHRALAAMAREVSYLGRAESWCDVELLNDGRSCPAPNCQPVNGAQVPGDVEPVRVLCPAESMTQDDLERTTAALQREGWSDPPGTRWIVYLRPSGALTARTPAASPSRYVHRPTVAEFALGGRVLPLFTDALLVAEQMRAAALSLHTAPSETLSGRAADGAPLRGQHRHAHYIPEARGATNRVTHVLVWAPAGLSETEQAALAGISFLTQRHNRPTLDVVLSGFGDRDDFVKASPLFGISRRWRSRTPFVPTRHTRRGKELPADQVARELRRRDLTEPDEVIPLAGARLVDASAGPSGLTRWIEFRTDRHGLPHPRGAMGFELVFREPQQGPLLLGYGSHFGLGQFEALP
jgi:CRISPR-associated protein Csb2